MEALIVVRPAVRKECVVFGVSSRRPLPTLGSASKQASNDARTQHDLQITFARRVGEPRTSEHLFLERRPEGYTMRCTYGKSILLLT